MSHVNTTAHYNLPIYGGNDIINPLTDVNGTNEAVDTAIYEVAQTLASGVTDITDIKNKVGDASLDTASQTLSGAINELKGVNDTQAGEITDIEANVGTLQTQMATTTGNITTLNTTVAGLQTEVSGKASQSAVNTLAEKVGTDALITTASDLSGAVNEIKNDITTLEEDFEKVDPNREPDVVVTADGIKNLRQLITEVADAVNLSKVTPFAVIDMRVNDTAYSFGAKLGCLNGGDGLRWSYCSNFIEGTTVIAQLFTCMAIKSSSSSGASSNAIAVDFRNGTVTVIDQSTLIPESGSKFKVYY